MLIIDASVAMFLHSFSQTGSPVREEIRYILTYVHTHATLS